MSRHRKVNFLAWGALGLTALVTLLPLYWSLVPFTPILEIPNNKLGVVNKEVNAGESLILEYYACKNSDMTGLVTRYLEDSQIIALPDVNSRFPKGCDNYRLPVMIPINTPTDYYTFHSQVTYKVSPMKTVTYEFQTDKFKVNGKIL